MEIKQVSFNGLLKPKFFLELKDGELSTYVHSCPLLLRVRLFLAALKLKRMRRKLEKFKGR